MTNTDEVRRRWTFAMTGDRIHRIQQYFDEFDAWLNQIKAEVWQEGYESGFNDYMTERPEHTRNPYVKEV